MASKHNRIIRYIESLPVGEKISVRSIAKNLSMSEGTAYRAIKDAEEIGLVSTIERVGTIRIERKIKDTIETLTFREIVKVIDGEVFGGEAGLDNVLKRFIIGAMKEDAMLRYIQPESLMIIGNRDEAQKLSLKNGAAVLITGGFQPNESLKQLADELAIPVLGTSYDTFTVASLINRAMSAQLIKEKVLTVSDVFIPLENTCYLLQNQTGDDYVRLREATGHSRFPVVTSTGRLMGIVTAKDILNRSTTIPMERIATKNPTYTKMHTSVASVAHQMIWNGIEMMPVVKDNMELEGIISRADVMRAMQSATRQNQVGNTIEDEVANAIKKQVQPDTLEIRYTFPVTPLMTNGMGMISFGVLCEVLSSVTKEHLLKEEKKVVVIEQMSLQYIKMIQMDTIIHVRLTILDLGRKSAKADVEVYVENTLMAKALVALQVMERN